MRLAGIDHSILGYPGPDQGYGRKLAQRVERAAGLTRKTFDRDEMDHGLCHGASGRALALHVMNGLPRVAIGQKLANTRPAFSVDDHSLMTGSIGRTITRLAIEGVAPTPLAFSLTHHGTLVTHSPEYT
jgi:hypothetical protein